MKFTTWAVVAVALATASVALTTMRGIVPGEKRTHLFERTDGSRDTPFETGDDEEVVEPADREATCRSCHTELPVASYRYCRYCVAAD